MVAPVYIEPVSLEDYFWSVHSRSVTDRQALDWTEHHIASGKRGSPRSRRRNPIA